MNLENRLLNIVAGIAPWLAPLIPTYFAAYNAYEYLAKGRHWWDAVAVVVVALVVELIGLAGVHTAIQFWGWNRVKNKSDDAAPLGLAILAVVVYIVIIIAVNALLDFFAISASEELPYVKIVAVALLSLLSLNSALIVALRAGQSNREKKAEREKQERKEARKEARKEKLTGNFPENFPNALELSENFPTHWRKVRQKLTTEQRAELASMSTEAICYRYGISDRTARNWRKSAQIEMQEESRG